MTGVYIAAAVLLLLLAVVVYRDMRREVLEIYRHVLVPLVRLPLECCRAVGRIRFRIRDLLALTFLAAVFCAALHYSGYWALLLLPILTPVCIDRFRRARRWDG